MFNKYGHINEDFFGSYDEDEFKDELVNDIENELVGEKVPTNITELDSYKYKFEFYFTGMKYSKIPAVNVARFAKFKRWFMYAVEQCHIIQNCSEPVFCAYLHDFQKTDEIKRFGDALFNNTDYDINHKIFWDTQNKKYG